MSHQHLHVSLKGASLKVCVLRLVAHNTVSGSNTCWSTCCDLRPTWEGVGELKLTLLTLKRKATLISKKIKEILQRKSSEVAFSVCQPYFQSTVSVQYHDPCWWSRYFFCSHVLHEASFVFCVLVHAPHMICPQLARSNMLTVLHAVCLTFFTQWRQVCIMLHADLSMKGMSPSIVCVGASRLFAMCKSVLGSVCLHVYERIVRSILTVSMYWKQGIVILCLKSSVISMYVCEVGFRL